MITNDEFDRIRNAMHAVVRAELQREREAIREIVREVVAEQVAKLPRMPLADLPRDREYPPMVPTCVTVATPKRSRDDVESIAG